MENVSAKSCKNLFVKCIILQIVFNTFFTVFILGLTVETYMEGDDIVKGLVLSVLQLCVSFLIGFYIRRKNHAILLREEQERKRYARITLIGVIVLLVTIADLNALFGEIFYQLHMGIITMVYKIFGVNPFLTIFDISSLFICLGTVFFKGKAKKRGVLPHTS